MPNPLTLSDAADLIDASIQDIFVKGSEKETEQYKDIFNVETGVSDYYLKDSSVSGLSYASRIIENAAVTAQSPIQGYDKTYTQVQFGVLMSFTKPMWFFGIKKRDLTNITQEARKACSDKREVLCFDRLDNGYNTAYTIYDDAGNYSTSIAGGDAVAMFSASHTREDGGTAWNNIVYDGTTYNMDFEYDAIKAAHRTAALVRNPKGKKMNINLDTLVVSKGYANHFRAIEILGSLRKGWQPATSDNEGPGIAEYKIVATPWITTNTDYWFMFDSTMKGPKFGLQYKESQPIQLEGPNVVFRTGEIQYKATMMFDIGFNDARNWVGSTNLNS
jgi:hypothetical protein